MGRRSINTTKSGKYMNPTDQARKEARKKELKKNKKQRQMVRAAVLKNKDPSQILEEMEKIDEMEYNVLQPSPLNEKVLRDKRKKLKETFDRVMRLYHNDEPDHWADLKRKEVEYEKKRLKKQQYYESVKHAQSVQIDEIPLPSSTQTTTPSNTAAGVGSASNLAAYPASAKRLPPPPTALSLPPFAPGAPPGALKTSNDIGNKQQEGGTNENETKKKEPLGVPIGPSPDLQQMSDLDTDAEDNEVVLKKYVSKSKSNKIVPKPNSLQQRMLAISGQNIDDFMKEMENVHKKKELERSSGAKAETENTKEIIVEKNNQSDESDSDDSSNSDTEDSDPVQKRAKKESNTTKPSPSSITLPPAAQTQPPPMAIAIPPAHFPIGGLAPPPPIMFRPPPRPPAMHGFGIRMPPGPPPGPRGMGGMPRMRMPGPPPGLPPRMAQHHKNLNNKDNTKGVTTITAKPQIRNLSADVTRFVPSTLRVKREETTRKPNKSKSYAQEGQQQIETSNNAASKDDAYMQFMNEMQGLL